MRISKTRLQRRRRRASSSEASWPNDVFSYEGIHFDAWRPRTLLIFEMTAQRGSSQVYSGLLGGGAFRGNRPLVCLLHLLLQPTDGTSALFHHPIFWSFGGNNVGVLESRVVGIAGQMMGALQRCAVSSVSEAIDQLLSWKLPVSKNDKDLSCTVDMPITIQSSCNKESASIEDRAVDHPVTGTPNQENKRARYHR